MESFFSRYRNALVLITVLLAQVIGLAVQVRRPGQGAGDKGGVRLIRSWSMDIVAPPERLLHATGLGLRGIWFTYIDLIHVRQQNRDLQKQLDDLRLEEASLAEDARQGLRLQSLLGFQEKYIYKTVAAQVIGASGTEQSHVLFIDKGSDDGIRPDMAVITPDGIVGKTRDVFRHTAQVLEISDATSGAGVIMEKTRIQGVLRGNSWGQPEIVNVSPDDRIKPGEPVITSGGDAIYPRGLPVGTVQKVAPDPDGTLVNVLVKPAANLARLEEVLIITSTGDRMPSQMQNDLSEAQQSAAEILAARLPSRHEGNATANGQQPGNQSGNQPGTQPGTGQQSSLQPPTLDNGTPQPPPQPPPPIHADRYSPMATPPATDMVPGGRAAVAEGAEVTPEAPRPDTASRPPSTAEHSPATHPQARTSAGTRSGSAPAQSSASGTAPRTRTAPAASESGAARTPAGRTADSTSPGGEPSKKPARTAHPADQTPAAPQGRN